MVVRTATLKTCKVPVTSPPLTYQHSTTSPSCHSTNSGKALNDSKREATNCKFILMNFKEKYFKNKQGDCRDMQLANICGMRQNQFENVAYSTDIYSIMMAILAVEYQIKSPSQTSVNHSHVTVSNFTMLCKIRPNNKPRIHTHTHSILTAIIPGEPGLAGCPLNSPSPFIPGLCILLGQA